MLTFCSTGRACLGMLLVDICSGHMNFGNAAVVLHRVVAVLRSITSLFEGTVRELIYTGACIVVVVHLWGRLGVVQVVHYSAFEIA